MSESSRASDAALIALQGELDRIVALVHANGGELQAINGRLRIVTPGHRSARVALGATLHNDVRVFARRFVEWLRPAQCTACRRLEVPRHGQLCAHCGR